MSATSPHQPFDRRPADRRDRALARPRRAARWVTATAAAATAVIFGVVAHQLPGVASTSASGSSSSPGTGAGSASTGSTGSSSGASSSTPTVTPSTTTPTVVSGGSSVR